MAIIPSIRIFTAIPIPHFHMGNHFRDLHNRILIETKTNGPLLSIIVINVT